MTTDIAVQDINKELISEIALEIGKDMVAYLEIYYPEVFAVMNSGCKLSIRNHIHNDIMWAIRNRHEGEYREWIKRRQENRRKMLKSVRARRAQPHDISV